MLNAIQKEHLTNVQARLIAEREAVESVMELNDRAARSLELTEKERMTVGMWIEHINTQISILHKALSL